MKIIPLSLLGVSLVTLPLVSPAAATNSGVQLTKFDDRVRVEINGQLFTEYVFKGASKPYCYPIIGPTGTGMTRNWPMKETPDEERDHPHHMGLWFGHQKVNSDNFWTVTTNSGKIVQETVTVANSGSDAAAITAQNKWIGKSGAVILTDERTLRFYNRTNDRVMDFEITFKASEGDVTFGDTKEGTMGIRSHPALNLKGKVAAGHALNSEGLKDGDIWGKPARWVDYSGPIDGKVTGIACFDHPLNLRHPTPWHARDYGLIAANPFGLHDFDKKNAKGAGDHTIKKEESLIFRYRWLFHTGDTATAKIEERWKKWAGK